MQPISSATASSSRMVVASSAHGSSFLRRLHFTSQEPSTKELIATWLASDKKLQEVFQERLGALESKLYSEGRWLFKKSTLYISKEWLEIFGNKREGICQIASFLLSCKSVKKIRYQGEPCAIDSELVQFHLKKYQDLSPNDFTHRQYQVKEGELFFAPKIFVRYFPLLSHLPEKSARLRNVSLHDLQALEAYYFKEAIKKCHSNKQAFSIINAAAALGIVSNHFYFSILEPLFNEGVYATRITQTELSDKTIKFLCNWVKFANGIKEREVKEILYKKINEHLLHTLNYGSFSNPSSLHAEKLFKALGEFGIEKLVLESGNYLTELLTSLPLKTLTVSIYPDETRAFHYLRRIKTLEELTIFIYLPSGELNMIAEMITQLPNLKKISLNTNENNEQQLRERFPKLEIRRSDGM